MKEEHYDEVGKATYVESDFLKQLNNDCGDKATVVESVGQEEDIVCISTSTENHKVKLEPIEDLSIGMKHEGDTFVAVSKKKKSNEDELSCKFRGKIYNVLYYLALTH